MGDAADDNDDDDDDDEIDEDDEDDCTIISQDICPRIPCQCWNQRRYGCYPEQGEAIKRSDKTTKILLVVVLLGSTIV
ncbi:hypothetical protein PoB_007198900 [Plakobranchus ocellatus]|uniref:Uncharacterized protein n=1 Tax=Plakobranchus ocellatus TaxID=259542 RepID=A0AAV4DMT2_9GAST|nr:hypothetical protein PoB_007198900 [Plakobranchus ocellatus]